MGRKKTTEEFKKELYNLVKDEYTLIGEYDGKYNDVQLKHNICGTVFPIKARKLLERKILSFCPMCMTEKEKRIFLEQIHNKEDFEKKVCDIDNNFRVIGDYISTHKPILMEHLICHRQFYIQPANFLQRRRCPLCAMDRARENPFNKRSKEDFEKIVLQMYNGKYKLVGDYKNNISYVKFLCNACNHIWTTTPVNFQYHKVECPYCSRVNNKTELEILDWAKKEYPKYTFEKKHFSRGKGEKWYEIDMFISELNIGFEYNGTRWHSFPRKDKNYHKDKQQFFKEQGITLYYLWEHWGENFCKNVIKHILLKDNQIEIDPYIKEGRKYLYANKDLYPEKPPYIKGYKFIKEVTRPEKIEFSNTREFTIYNSGYYQYIKQ